VAITDRIQLKNHRQIQSQLETNIPKRAFAGATLDVFYAREGLAQVDDATRDRLEAFAEDFLVCDCEGAPHCGCGEEAFVSYLLDLRASGLGPDAIVDVMEDDYLLTAYSGDVLGFLDESIRTLEALEALAEVDEQNSVARAARQRRDDLVR